MFTDGRQQRQSQTQSYIHILCLLTEDNNNPIIIRPHIVFTDGRQQRQPNQTQSYLAY